MVVALADSFFFDIDPNGARSKVLAFLLVSFAPFLLVAPMIGPMIDRIRGGRRAVIQLTAVARIVVQLLMIQFLDGLALFPLVFIALVLQKTYAVSKSAIVPSVVNNDRQLVEANSKLGVIAGIAGAVAVIPAGGLQLAFGGRATLAYSVVVFVLALAAALRLPRGEPANPDIPSAASNEFTTTSLQIGWAAMVVLRSLVGFMLFHLAFWFRDQGTEGTLLLGVAVAAASGATMLGNAVSPFLRNMMAEEKMLTVALVLPLAVGAIATVLGGNVAGIALAASVNLAAALGRLSFESIVQRDGPATNRGEAFAQFETRFQAGWVIGAVIPVVIDMPATAGYLLVAVVAGSAAANYLIELGSGRSPKRSSRRTQATTRRAGRSTDQELRSRPVSASSEGRSTVDAGRIRRRDRPPPG